MPTVNIDWAFIVVLSEASKIQIDCKFANTNIDWAFVMVLYKSSKIEIHLDWAFVRVLY